jgi:hypothetical protein
MSRARRLAVALVSSAIAVLPSPVAAKGIDQTLAIVSGPGLAHPLILEREEWSQALLIGYLIGDSPEVRPSPSDRLGPAYEVHIQLSIYDPRADWPILSMVRQRLYPFATPAPLTYTPPQFWRNPFGSDRMDSGWQAVPPTLVEQLQRFGLPERPPIPTGPAPAGAALPLGLAAVGIALAAVASRRRGPVLAA